MRLPPYTQFEERSVHLKKPLIVVVGELEKQSARAAATVYAHAPS
jgi:hypothetical protein